MSSISKDEEFFPVQNADTAATASYPTFMEGNPAENSRLAKCLFKPSAGQQQEGCWPVKKSLPSGSAARPSSQALCQQSPRVRNSLSISGLAAQISSGKGLSYLGRQLLRFRYCFV